MALLPEVPAPKIAPAPKPPEVEAPKVVATTTQALGLRRIARNEYVVVQVTVVDGVSIEKVLSKAAEPLQFAAAMLKREFSRLIAEI